MSSHATEIQLQWRRKTPKHEESQVDSHSEEKKLVELPPCVDVPSVQHTQEELPIQRPALLSGAGDGDDTGAREIPEISSNDLQEATVSDPQ